VRTILVMLVLFAAAPMAAPVAAQPVEQAYIAAHDRAITALQKKWGDCLDIKDVNAMWAEVGQFRPGLEAAIRRAWTSSAVSLRPSDFHRSM
jgi:hypothetical protein